MTYKKKENLIKKLMTRKPIREATGLIRNGLPQLNYYNQILTELYKKKSMAELNSKS